jgi:hypothetical protein
MCFIFPTFSFKDKHYSEQAYIVIAACLMPSLNTKIYLFYGTVGKMFIKTSLIFPTRTFNTVTVVGNSGTSHLRSSPDH